MEGCGDHKRRRDELEDEDSPQISSPEAKRLLLDILDDDAEAVDQDIASVMKSLEEEIALPSPPPQPQFPQVQQPDLGFLFEASDDELGLPPAPPSSEEADEHEPVVADVTGDAEAAGFGQIWGFDDDISGYEGFDGGLRQEKAETEDGVLFDGEDGVLFDGEDGVLFNGEWFDYADVPLYLPYDFAEISWRPETLPAV